MKVNQIKLLEKFDKQTLIDIIQRLSEIDKQNQQYLDALLVSDRGVRKQYESWSKKVQRLFWLRNGDLRVPNHNEVKDMLAWIDNFPHESERLLLLLDFIDGLAMLFEVVFELDDRLVVPLELALDGCMFRSIDWTQEHRSKIESIQSRDIFDSLWMTEIPSLVASLISESDEEDA